MRIVYEVTRRCNLQCKYCYEGFKGTKPLNKERLLDPDDFVKFVYELLINNEPVLIQFHGGEPLLEYKHIKEIITRIRQLSIYEKYKSKIEFTIVTNGIFLDEEKIKWFKENDLIKYCISHDIVSNITQEMRHNILDKNWLFNKLDILLKHKTLPEISYVITKKHIELGPKNFIQELVVLFKYVKEKHNYMFTTFNLTPVDPIPYLYFYNIGIYNDEDILWFQNNMFINYDEFFEFYFKSLQIMQQNYIDLIDPRYQNNILLLERNSNLVLQNYYNCNTNFIDSGIPCKMGTELLAVTPNGDIYPCTKIIDLLHNFKELKDIFLLGNIKSFNFKNYNQQLIKFKEKILNNLYYHNIPCHFFCEKSETCSYCIVHNYMLYNYFDSYIGNFKCIFNNKIHRTVNTFKERYNL
ncbi:hypothetical protein DEFDS_P249 (plasmid) [Deferribacter desulfuricans SSM1]|uniref:Radical SAM core domain-containing protein n=1 Tax=Deferribacter desulfuricans (strain DSM 14783 / JCM 11476 / NBRC 101012 / SSM1) TaxID=639282 RepID=D3PF77_DEFDS|nr:radical SAM protein [Deferribacter desulfuricans]BAI81869.1 hypothetical protein DEFDS_P249 [Deferribacter desulfuricans SSM1]